MTCYWCAKIRSGAGTPTDPAHGDEAVCYMYVASSPTKLKPMCRVHMDVVVKRWAESRSMLQSSMPHELPLEGWEEALVVCEVMEELPGATGEARRCRLYGRRRNRPWELSTTTGM